MVIALRKAFNSRDFFRAYFRDRRLAGAYGFAIKMDSARAAQSGTAAIFCASQVERITQDPQKRRIGRDIDLAGCSVNYQLKGGQSRLQTSLQALALSILDEVTETRLLCRPALVFWP